VLIQILLAVLRQPDVARKGYLLRFLHESRLLSTLNPSYLSLASANLTHIFISSAERRLSRLIFIFLDFTSANMIGAKISEK
jgi:hypothetical protein